MRDAVIVRLHAKQPGDKRPVRAVAAPRGGKAAVKQDLGLGRLLPQESPRRAADAHAPAVWLLDGPVMTGPSTSNNRITDTSLIKWYRMSIADLARDCKARAEKEENVKNNNISQINFYVYRGKCLKKCGERLETNRFRDGTETVVRYEDCV